MWLYYSESSCSVPLLVCIRVFLPKPFVSNFLLCSTIHISCQFFLQSMSSTLKASEPPQSSVKSDLVAWLQGNGNALSNRLDVFSNSWKHTKRWWSQTPPGKLIDKKLPGWRLVVACAILLGSLVLLGNSAFLIVATTKSKTKRGPNGLGTLYEGDCGEVEWGYTIAKVVINFLSTV